MRLSRYRRSFRLQVQGGPTISVFLAFGVRFAVVSGTDPEPLVDDDVKLLTEKMLLSADLLLICFKRYQIKSK